jgi:uncharacterized repeat protein (TIGR01451 family)
MKHTPAIQFRDLARLLAVCGIACPSVAAAAGVAAGSSIENTATATYSVGATTASVDSNTVSILVDELLDVTVGSLDAGNVTLGSSGAVLSFEIGNIGNGPEAFDLTIDPALGGDDFDPAVVQIAYDSNGNGAYDSGVDTVIPVGGSTPSIDADNTLRVFVITQLAGSPDDGDTADLRLTAAAATGSGTPGTTFAGQGEGGGDAVVGAGTAEDFDNGTLVASLSTVSLVKSAAIVDPFGGAQAVPGARVTYTLVASVTGSASVSGLTVADPIPAGTTYDASTLTLESAPLTDATGDDAGQASTAGISVDLGTVAGGASRTIRFSVTIDQ